MQFQAVYKIKVCELRSIRLRSCFDSSYVFIRSLKLCFYTQLISSFPKSKKKIIVYQVLIKLKFLMKINYNCFKCFF